MDDTTSPGGVSFEEERVYTTPPSAVSKKGLAGWLSMNSFGIVKSEKEAEYVLIGVAGIGIIVSIILFIHALNPIPDPPTDFDEVAAPPPL